MNFNYANCELDWEYRPCLGPLCWISIDANLDKPMTICIYMCVCVWTLIMRYPSRAAGHTQIHERPRNNSVAFILSSTIVVQFFWHLVLMFLYCCRRTTYMPSSPPHPCQARPRIHAKLAAAGLGLGMPLLKICWQDEEFDTGRMLIHESTRRLINVCLHLILYRYKRTNNWWTNARKLQLRTL
jgi:hypothetical protein